MPGRITAILDSSPKGLSRLVIEYAPQADSKLVTAGYCISEVEKTYAITGRAGGGLEPDCSRSIGNGAHPKTFLMEMGVVG